MSNRIFVDYLPTPLSLRLGTGLAIAALASVGGSFSDAAFAQAKKGAVPPPKQELLLVSMLLPNQHMIRLYHNFKMNGRKRLAKKWL